MAKSCAAAQTHVGCLKDSRQCLRNASQFADGGTNSSRQCQEERSTQRGQCFFLVLHTKERANFVPVLDQPARTSDRFAISYPLRVFTSRTLRTFCRSKKVVKAIAEQHHYPGIACEHEPFVRLRNGSASAVNSRLAVNAWCRVRFTPPFFQLLLLRLCV